MRFITLVAFVLAVSAISCQQIELTPLQKCINDIKADFAVLTALRTAIQTKNIGGIFTNLAKVQPLAQQTKADCDAAGLHNVQSYAQSHLEEKPVQCAADILAGIANVSALTADILRKKPIEAALAAFGLVGNVNKAISDCA